jgi:3-phenylpropionate/cinnamic acid dioxygenase small subunit
MRFVGVVACAVLSLTAAGRAHGDDVSAAAVQKLLDRAEIEDVVARYVTALDTLDADAYAGVFTDDAVYDVTGTVYKGRAAIRKIVTDLQAARAKNEAEGRQSPRLYHVMANPSLEILDATHARHRCYAQTVRAAAEGGFVVGFMGRYEDELVKVDGHWLIQSRKLVSFVPPAAR